MPITPVGDLMIALKADIDDYQKSMATASDIAGGVSGSLRSLAKTARNTGAVLTGIGVAASAAMFGFTRAASNMAERYREVGTLIGNVSGAMDKYSGMVRRVSRDMAVQGGEIATVEALYQSLSAGVSQATDKQEEFLRQSAALARVGQADLATTVDILTTSLNAYNLEVEAASRISDTLFATVQEGKVRLDELASVMGRVFALGSEVNASIEELSAGMAVLTARGFEARIAGTALRAAMRQMLRPSENLEAILFDIAAQQNLVGESSSDLMNRLMDLRAETEDLRASIQDINAALTELENQNSKLGRKIRQERLKIMKIRAEAAKEDRELTDQEKERIEDIRADIKQLRVSRMENRIEIDKKKETLAEEEKQLEENKKKQSEMVSQLEDVDEAIGTLVVDNMGLIETFQLVQERAEELGIPMSEVITESRAMQGVFSLLGDEGEKWAEVHDLMQKKGALTEEQFNRLAEAGDDFESVLKEFRESGELTEEQFEAFMDAGEASKDNFEELQSVYNTFGENFADTTESKLQKSFEELRIAIREVGYVFQEQFGDQLMDIANRFSNFADKVDSLSESTKQSIARFLMLGTGIALTLGPLLFFGGQIALIAGALGSALIPVLGVTAGLVGILAATFSDLTKPTGEAESALGQMASVHGRLMHFMGRLKDIFKNEILPGLIEFGEGMKAALSAVAAGITNVTSESEEGEDAIRAVAGAFGDLLGWLGQFLKDNSALIESIVETAVRMGKILTPAVVAMGSAFKAVAVDIFELVSSMLEWMSEAGIISEESSSISGALIELTKAFSNAVIAVSNFVEEHSEMFAALTLAAGAAYGAFIAVGKFTTAISALKSSKLAKWLTYVTGKGRDFALFTSRAHRFVLSLASGAIQLSSALAGLVAPLKGLIPGLGAAYKGLLILKGVIIGITSVALAPLIAGVAVVSSVLIALKENTLNARGAVMRMWDTLWSVLDVFYRLGKFLVGQVMYVLNEVEKSLAKNIEGFETWAQALNILKDTVLPAVHKALGLFGGALLQVASLLARPVKYLAEIFLPVFKSVFRIAAFVISTFLDAVITFVAIVVALFGGDLSKAGELFLAFWERTINRIGDLLAGLVGDWFDIVIAILRSVKAFGDWLVEMGVDIGTGFIDAIIKGLKDKKDEFVDAVKGAAEDAAEYLPSSDAEKGPFSDLTGSGEAIPKTMAEGVENGEDDLQQSLEGMGGMAMEDNTDPAIPMGGDIEGDPQLNMEGGMKQEGDEIHVHEKAVYFEAGAFQGVSDEEVVEMAREETETALQEIIESSRGKGLEP